MAGGRTTDLGGGGLLSFRLEPFANGYVWNENPTRCSGQNKPVWPYWPRMRLHNRQDPIFKRTPVILS